MNFDLIVIGSGPGGYPAAIRASQLGMKVAIVERESLGGICLNWGCIPTKALLKSAQVYNYINKAQDFGIEVVEAKIDFNAMIKRSRNVAVGMSKGISFLMRKNKIAVIEGEGKLVRGKKVVVTNSTNTKKEYSADHIIIATGGRAKELPNLPIDGKKIIGYREAMSLPKQPASMVIIGAGAIGVEFAHFYNSIGTKVTIVEYQKGGLLPNEDKEVTKALTKIFKSAGITVMDNTTVKEVDTKTKILKVSTKSNADDKVKVLECDVVLSSVGVSPNTENLGLETVGVQTDQRGLIEVDAFYKTSVHGVYAIGDIINTPALAHVATAEAITCVEKIAGLNVEAIDYSNIPACTYCEPEVASLGMTEQKAIDAGYDIKIGKFPFSASGKASASGAKHGFVKMIFDAEYGELLGAHMIGSNVTEMIAELVAAKKLETTGHEILKAIHPHPTMSEAVMEATAAAYDEVIHL